MLAAAAIAVAACTGSPDYRLPDVEVPAAYPSDPRAPDGGVARLREGADFPPAAVAADRWWLGFGDPGLDALVDDVLLRNRDLATAALRVRRAQLDAGLVADALRPRASGGATADYTHPLDSGDGGQHGFGASFAVRYEADLWGRLRNARDAALLEAQASAEDREAVALVLVATAARLYATLAFLNQRIVAADASLALAAKTRDLVAVQYRAGAVSGVALRESLQSLSEQQAGRSALVQQQLETRNAIAVLRAGEAWPQAREAAGLGAIAQPALPVAVPAELLGRRPDLRAAELRLRRAFAEVDVVRSSYYPALDLVAAAGGSGSDLGRVLRDPVGTLGAALSLPFLGWNEMQLSVSASKVDLEIAVSGFRQSLHQALAEVDNALSGRTRLSEQRAARADSFAEAIAIERLYGIRYRAGAEPLRVWLEAQESRRIAEIALARTQLEQFLNDVLLFQSLGGGAQPLR